MKQTAFHLSLLLMVLSTFSYAQVDSSQAGMNPPEWKSPFFNKSVKQKNIAWTLLICGVAMDGLGAAILPRTWDDIDKGFEKTIASSALFVVGSAGIISSIPIFFAAGRNRRRRV